MIKRLIINIYGKITELNQFIKYGGRLGEFHKGCFIEKPLKINGLNNIYMKKGSYIYKNAYIIARPLTGERRCELIIGENSYLNIGSHVVSTKSVVIGNNVSVAPYVFISDNTHDYSDILTPVEFSPIKQLRTVRIGDDSWIGRGVAILGCSIGKHCVIGANSVVNKDIPDYCIVGGVPARIIKRYDFEKREWRKTDKVGRFVDDTQELSDIK